MRDALLQVAQLQQDFSATNTPQMKTRGILIRQAIPNQLRDFQDDFARKIGIPVQSLLIEGRDGTGRKTELPWIRVADERRSPSATTDWYVVYLFDALGDSIFLTIGHGSTEWDGIDFRPRPPTELRRAGAWARDVLREKIFEKPNVETSIELKARRSNLGPAYEAGTALAVQYQASNLPDDNKLLEDLLAFLEMLGDVYRASAAQYVPGEQDPIVGELIESASTAAGRSNKRGQGFRLSAPLRRAIELRGMEVARLEMTRLGWTDIRDTSATKPFDFLCKDGQREISVEVKGSVSIGESIVLTRGEVEHHTSAYPNNALILVTEIGLQDGRANGGNVKVIKPWKIHSEYLTAISYTYTTLHRA